MIRFDDDLSFSLREKSTDDDDLRLRDLNVVSSKRREDVKKVMR
jgi:hypothetical protein